jgi:hypothetical protein
VKKAEEERGIHESKQKHIDMLNEEVRLATLTRDKLSKQVSKHRKFPKFIEDVYFNKLILKTI